MSREGVETTVASLLGTYRIRAVSELVGLSTATLRAWERRYGVPAPTRTASDYRLYSQADVNLLLHMRSLVEEGIAPAEAARHVLEQRPVEPIVSADIEVDPFAVARDRIVAATVRLDPDALQHEINLALGLGSAITIVERAFAPALQRIGQMWHEGTITIAQEHLLSQFMATTLSDLVRLAQPPDASRCVTLACFADEEHVIALYSIALRFTSWGFRTVMLGARTPPAAIGRMIEALAPDVVALSVTMAPPPARARELVDAYADVCRGVAWVVGGQAAEFVRPWVEARGGLVANTDLRARLERVLAGKRRQDRD